MNNLPVEKVGFSFIVCAYNEASVIRGYLQEIDQGLKNRFGLAYELLVMENGSTDETIKILDAIKNPQMRIFHLPEKGHGAAIRLGIKSARYNSVALIGLDLPFGFSDMDGALPLWSDHDLIFGSKAHPKSILHVTWKRRVASFIYRRLYRFILGIKIRDTQGSIFMKRDRVLTIVEMCDSPNAFFSTQLAFYAGKSAFKMAEISVTMRKTDLQRKSKYNIFRDGMKMLKSLLLERLQWREKFSQRRG